MKASEALSAPHELSGEASGGLLVQVNGARRHKEGSGGRQLGGSSGGHGGQRSRGGGGMENSRARMAPFYPPREFHIRRFRQ